MLLYIIVTSAIAGFLGALISYLIIKGGSDYEDH